MQGLSIEPLGGTVGAEIHGVDVARGCSEDQVRFIRAALLEYHVVFFPRQSAISVEAQMAFGRCFGPLETDFPSFATRLDGRPEVITFDGDRPGGRASIWHTDVSVSSTPPMGCILYMKTVPERGGDTMWADMCAAFDSLSPVFQRVLESMRAVHDMFTPEYRERPGGFDPRAVTEMDFSYVSRAEHPVVRVHPESQRRSLFVNPFFTSHILGLHAPESALLLNFLYGHMQSPQYVYRRHWSEGDVAFWDNRCTMHCAVDDYGKRSRLAHRVSIKGDVPFGVA